MKFDLVAFSLAVSAAIFAWTLISICVRLHITRSEILLGKRDITIGPFLSEFIGLIGSILWFSYVLFSRLNL